MITKEEFINAQKIVDIYNLQISKDVIKDYTCICCKENKVKLFTRDFTQDPLKQEGLMWSGGAISLLECGFGSKNDGSKYYIAICDECIEKMENDKIVVNFDKLSNEIDKFKEI